jgi:energy-converting hydrogenase B subunit P
VVILLKIIVRAHHIISLGGYIVERNFPYRDVIVVNKTSEPIKVEVPVFNEEWVVEHRDLGLDLILVNDDDNFLSLFRKAKADLDLLKAEIID